MGRRDEMVEAEDRGWAEIGGNLGRLSPEQMQEPGATADGWTVKDILWHLCCWTAEAARQLERIHMGTYVEQDWDTDGLNARYLEEGRGQDLATVRAELAAARSRVMAEWAQIDELTPAAEEWFEESGALHYHDHLAELRAFADRVASSG